MFCSQRLRGPAKCVDLTQADDRPGHSRGLDCRRHARSERTIVLNGMLITS
jgi:hypothetical protein